MDNFTKIAELDKSPETQKIVENIINIMNYISTDEMMVLKNNNFPEFQNHMYEKEEFKDFITKYFSLFTMLIDKQLPPFKNLITMITVRSLFEAGKITDTEAMIYIREHMADQYIYPKFGGKDKFEKCIKKRAASNGKNKKNKK